MRKILRQIEAFMNKLESEELDSTTFYGLPVHTDHLVTIIKQAKERDDQRGRGRQWP